MRLLLISGPLAVGKSAVANELVQSCGFQRIRSGEYLSKLAAHRKLDASRSGLQNLGDMLDRETDFRWLIDEVAAPAILARDEVKYWLIDSVRKNRQVTHFKNRFGKDAFHIHLNASEELLRTRYEKRLLEGNEYVGNTPYEQAIKHPNEIASRGLLQLSDHVVEVDSKTAVEVSIEIMGKLSAG